MTKLIGNNRVIAALFLLLIVMNAFAIQNNWYA